MGRIITKNSSTAGTAPTGLVKGELAINVVDGKLYYGDGSTTKLLSTSGSGGGGGTVTSVQLTAGTGISLGGTNPITTTGNITITNSDPDQTVTLGSGNGINVTGTYPNFTIASTISTSGFLTTSSFNSYTSSAGSQFAGTASFATTASYVLNAGTTIDTGSFVTTSSFNAFTQSINTATSSFVTNNQTSSFVQNSQTSSFVTTSSFNSFTSSYNTGSFSGSFTGSLFGTASFATSASQAVSASYASNGGVTQLLAGPNITLSPTNGLGQVTINSTGGGSSFNTATGSYGSFYSTQTQTNVAGTARSMSLNVTDITNGVSISGSTNPFNTYIKTQNAGVYNIQFSAQVDKTDSGTDEIWIWIRKNDTDLSDTATSIQLTGNGAHYVAAWNFFVNAAANDYFQLMWYSPDANVRLHAEPAFGVVPGIPSLIVTANRVDQFLSNTGSFSGSFTGNLIGTASTASYITASDIVGTVLSASYAQTASYALTSAGGSGGISRIISSSITNSITASAAASTDYVYLVSGTATITLPTAVNNTNLYIIKRTSTNIVTVAASGSQTIDGGATASLNVQYQSIDLISDNANWNII